MSLKKKLAMGIATGALAVSMIGGGTYAYFNDVETSVNTFAAGTLDLVLNPEQIIKVDNLKPGDYMDRYFTLANNGTLDISEVLLSTSYTQNGLKKSDDFGKHIMVKFMQNMDKNGHAYPDSLIYEATLHELKTQTPELLEKLSNNANYEESGLGAGDSDNLIVRFEFIDNGKDQNHLQGAGLELTWKFNALQTEGERR